MTEVRREQKPEAKGGEFHGEGEKTFFTCPKGHKFGLPMTIGRIHNFVIFSRFDEDTACPVCWYGEDWDFKAKGLVFGRAPIVITKLGFKRDEIDWEHRGQHLDCSFCAYTIRAKSP